MSKWLVILTYEKKDSSGGNFAIDIPSTKVYYTVSKTHFVKFKGNYPTETEIRNLLEEKSVVIDESISSFSGERYVTRDYPTITFMQKLEEEEVEE